MSISHSGLAVQNGAELSLVVRVKEKQESHQILLELKGAVHNQRVEVFSQGGDFVFATKVDCVFLMWASGDIIFFQKPITLGILFM